LANRPVRVVLPDPMFPAMAMCMVKNNFGPKGN
jgi:hypothetical protein